MKIKNRDIGVDYSPYMVAEMSANHNGKLERALEIILAAKQSGADAIKLQTYRADTMTLNVDHPRFRVKGENPWAKEHLYDLYKKAATPWSWHEKLFDYGREIGITVFSSPFDSSAVDLLESLDCPAYKIASFELVDHDLIRCCAKTGQPMIMSTGMASIDEITEAVNVARDAGAIDLALLKCTSAYPAPYQDMNINTIPDLAKKFNVQTGLSDHTMGIGVSVSSIALGACIIEKHLTLSRDDGGVDSSFSLEPDEFSQLVNECRNAYLALGKVSYENGSPEKLYLQYRRSLFIVNDLEKGHVLCEKDIKALRPGYGLLPKNKKNVLGSTLKVGVKKGTPVSWDILKL